MRRHKLNLIDIKSVISQCIQSRTGPFKQAGDGELGHIRARGQLELRNIADDSQCGGLVHAILRLRQTGGKLQI